MYRWYIFVMYLEIVRDKYKMVAQKKYFVDYIYTVTTNEVEVN
jgi:hypothetical protein